MNQDQLDRIEEKLDTLNNNSKVVSEFLFSTNFWKKFEQNLKGLDEISEKAWERYKEVNPAKPIVFSEHGYGSDLNCPLPKFEPAQTQLIKQTKTPFSLIKRVEYFTDRHIDLKSNSIVEYYLFDFILIYRKILQAKESKSLFPEEILGGSFYEQNMPKG